MQVIKELLIFAEDLTDVRVGHSPGRRLSYNSVRVTQGQQAANNIGRLAVVNVSTGQNQNTERAIPYSIINPSAPTETTQYMAQDASYIQLPTQQIIDSSNPPTARQPPSSSNIAKRLLNQRPNVETPPPAFETVLGSNISPSSSNIRAEENRPAQSANTDPPPPYPGPPPGESSL